MRRMRVSGSTTLGLVVTVLLPLASACRSIPDPAFNALSGSLGLQIVEMRREPNRAVVSFKLMNRGRTDVKACLGPSRSVSYKGASIGVAFHRIDHPGCIRKFDMRPGEVISWTEAVDVALPAGRVDVDVKVEIVNPRRCDGWGCEAFDLNSTQIAID